MPFHVRCIGDYSFTCGKVRNEYFLFFNRYFLVCLSWFFVAEFVYERFFFFFLEMHIDTFLCSWIMVFVTAIIGLLLCILFYFCYVL